MSKKKVYIASPYTLGDMALNVKLQMTTANRLMDEGFIPFVPLYNHFQHMMYPRPDDEWIEIDKEWVTVCDVLLRLGGESSGADGEVALAQEEGIPVFYSIDDLIKLAS